MHAARRFGLRRCTAAVLSDRRTSTRSTRRMTTVVFYHYVRDVERTPFPGIRALSTTFNRFMLPISFLLLSVVAQHAYSP